MPQIHVRAEVGDFAPLVLLPGDPNRARKIAERFDAFVQNGGLSLWDIAAAGLIAERAGATVTDLYGGPWWNGGKRGPRLSIVAAPQRHHGTLLELLRAARTTVETRR